MQSDYWGPLTCIMRFFASANWISSQNCLDICSVLKSETIEATVQSLIIYNSKFFYLGHPRLSLNCYFLEGEGGYLDFVDMRKLITLSPQTDSLNYRP